MTAPGSEPREPRWRRVVLEYLDGQRRGGQRSLEGMLTPVIALAAREMRFDSLRLDEEAPLGGPFTLWFRHGAKRIFHVRVVRGGGRTLVELSGLNPTTALKVIHRLRDHFDSFLGVTPEQVQSFEETIGSGADGSAGQGAGSGYRDPHR